MLFFSIVVRTYDYTRNCSEYILQTTLRTDFMYSLLYDIIPPDISTSAKCPYDPRYRNKWTRCYSVFFLSRRWCLSVSFANIRDKCGVDGVLQYGTHNWILNSVCGTWAFDILNRLFLSVAELSTHTSPISYPIIRCLNLSFPYDIMCERLNGQWILVLVECIQIVRLMQHYRTQLVISKH